MRGEKLDQQPHLVLAQGSPPRARGKASLHFAENFLFGITPACAGKRWMCDRCGRMRRDHPRVRGEKLNSIRYWLHFSGSPPRARGKVTRIRPNVRHPGITPACAGKRGYPPFPQPHGRDHPRVRGEKGALFESGGGIQGSPPRARGKASQVRMPGYHQGITPACAGKR